MKRKVNGDQEENAVKTKWFSVTRFGIIMFTVIAFIVGLFTVLIFNVGYDNRQGGWFWKTNSLNVDIKLKKKE